MFYFLSRWFCIAGEVSCQVFWKNFGVWYKNIKGNMVCCKKIWSNQRHGKSVLQKKFMNQNRNQNGGEKESGICWGKTSWIPCRRWKLTQVDQRASIWKKAFCNVMPWCRVRKCRWQRQLPLKAVTVTKPNWTAKLKAKVRTIQIGTVVVCQKETGVVRVSLE